MHHKFQQQSSKHPATKQHNPAKKQQRPAKQQHETTKCLQGLLENTKILEDFSRFRTSLQGFSNKIEICCKH
jgi:hypothetical protein